MTEEVDADLIAEALGDGKGTVFEAYERYRRLGGKLGFSEFFNFLAIFGGTGREG